MCKSEIEDLCNRLMQTVRELMSVAMEYRKEGLEAGNVCKIMYNQGTIDILYDIYEILRAEKHVGKQLKDQTGNEEEILYR